MRYASAFDRRALCARHSGRMVEALDRLGVARFVHEGAERDRRLESLLSTCRVVGANYDAMACAEGYVVGLAIVLWGARFVESVGCPVCWAVSHCTDCTHPLQPCTFHQLVEVGARKSLDYAIELGLVGEA